MSADRCPSCAAVVRPDASWCGQCYASLRPAPAPAPAAAAAPTALAEPPVTELLEPDLGLPPALLAAPPAAAALDEVPAQPLPGVVPMPADQPTTWPCGRCQTAVPFDDDECPNCRARFLDSQLPGVDRTLLDKLPRGQRKTTNAALVMIVGGLTLMGIFIALFALLGVIFN